jgi:hypothetical protein
MAPTAKVVEATPILQETSERGRWIAALDLASWLATDALYARSPDRQLMGQHVARREGDIFRVAFGRILPDESAFCVACEAVCLPGHGAGFEVSVHDPPRKDRGWLLGTARAICRSQKAFPFHPRAPSYNCVVIPEEEARFSVYRYPGTKDAAAEVMGADGVVQVSPEGATEVTCYHKDLFVRPRLAPDPVESHTHTLIQEPVPMDVAYVLMRLPRSPVMIMSEAGMFLIDTVGCIYAVPVAPPAGT